MTTNEYGNIYEILLSNNMYVYVCWIEECSFGIFDYYSEKPAQLNQLLSLGFKTYKACKETAIKKHIWKLIGHLDLDTENIRLPDLAIFQNWNKSVSLQQSKVMRHGNLVTVPKNEYLSLLQKGYIYGFFDNNTKFEQWLLNNIPNYPHNQDISDIVFP